ncbi:hypothetical protein HDU76_013007, partial [Blyttiomyces sp. JEL0837]
MPESMKNLTKLQILDLGNNTLIGEIPNWIGELSSLSGLYLSANKLEGSIPKSIGSLTNLQTLNVFNNQLRGPIPDTIGRLQNLELVDVGFNYLNGRIPSSLGNLTALKYLDTGSFLQFDKIGVSQPWCQLSKRFNPEKYCLPREPAESVSDGEIKNFSSLNSVGLLCGMKGFTGTIPEFLGTLSELVVL